MEAIFVLLCSRIPPPAQSPEQWEDLHSVGSVTLCVSGCLRSFQSFRNTILSKLYCPVMDVKHVEKEGFLTKVGVI